MNTKTKQFIIGFFMLMLTMLAAGDRKVLVMTLKGNTCLPCQINVPKAITSACGINIDSSEGVTLRGALAKQIRNSWLKPEEFGKKAEALTNAEASVSLRLASLLQFDKPVDGKNQTRLQIGTGCNFNQEEFKRRMSKATREVADLREEK